MDNKETKKGFWSSLFAPKKESSCCVAGPGTKVSEVLVLGPGCAKCKKTYAVVEEVIKDNQLDVRLSKVEDIAEMLKFNIMVTPAVVVDGVVRIKGHVPSADEVKKALGI